MRPACAQCFDVETERKVLASGDLRSKPLHEFSPIYYEHPNCSVGADGFFHFLPRAIDTFDPDGGDAAMIILEKPLQCGLYALPEAEQIALRLLFARATIGWFRQRTPRPFGGAYGRECPRPLWRDDEIEAILIHGLVHLRVRPASVFIWLKELNNEWAWMFACRVIAQCHGGGFQPDFIEPEVYYAVAKDDEAGFRAMAKALGRIARSDFFAAIGKDDLALAWETVGMQDQSLYDAFHYADGLYDAVKFTQTMDERLSDITTIETVVARIQP